MRTIFTLAVAIGAVIAACGGDDDGGSDAEDLSDVIDQLNAAGLACDTTPQAYEADENELDLGEPPISEFTCEADGVEIEGTEWASENDRGVAMTTGSAMACDFGAVEFSWVEDGPWAVGTADGEDPEMIERIGQALGVEPSTTECDT